MSTPRATQPGAAGQSGRLERRCVTVETRMQPLRHAKVGCRTHAFGAGLPQSGLGLLALDYCRCRMWREILTQLFVGAFVGGGAYAVKQGLIQALQRNDWTQARRPLSSGTGSTHTESRRH